MGNRRKSTFSGQTMDCPDCGRKTAVIDTRKVGGGVRRRRECEGGHRFSTIERPESEEYQEEITRLHADVDELHRIIGALTMENNRLKGGQPCPSTS